MKTVKIDFKEITFKNLDEIELSLPISFSKDFGNIHYTSARDIDVADLARKIFESDKYSKDLILNSEELNLLHEIFDNIKLLGYPAHQAAKEYLKQKFETLNK